MKVSVYRGNYGWSILCKNDYNGASDKYYIPVYFKKCDEPDGDKAYIDITGAKFSCYFSKQKGETQPNLIIFDWKLVETVKEEQVNGKTEDFKDLNWF